MSDGGEMQAVRAHRRGGPEELRLERAPRPVPGPDEVLVEVRAASITPGELDWDATWTTALDDSGAPRLPIVPSKELSGVVAGTGEEVYGLIPFNRDGAAAQYVAVPSAVLAPKPPELDHVHAAALPLAGLTAWQGLVTHGGLERGQRVLVHGGAGGVGAFAVQVAAALGASVTATAAAQDAAFVRELGAEQVVDYAAERFEDVVAEIDLVFDTVGPAGGTQDRSWQVLKPGGVLVSVAAPPAANGPGGARGVFFVVEPDRAGLEQLSRLVAEGRLTVAVSATRPLAETAAAYADLARPHRRGKIVLTVS